MEINSDPVYTAAKQNGTVLKLIRIALGFKRELLEPFQFGTAIRALLVPLQKQFHLDIATGAIPPK